MIKTRQAIWLCMFATLLVALTSCANIVRPGGGEKDAEGPVALSVNPKHLSLHFDSKQVTFEFNEYLKPGGYSEEVFVSPVLNTPPDVLVSGKKLIIRFREDLKPNTTYVVSISANILDFTEGNPMGKPILYAFSTGDRIDTLGFRGQVFDEMAELEVKGMTMLLFESDSVPDNNIRNLRPAYAAMVEEGGTFFFKYLKPGKYKLFGIKDLDKSYSWSQDKEAVAISNQAEVLVDSSFKTPDVVLKAFLMDEDWPRIKSAKWMDDENIIVEFKEPLRRTWKGDSLRISMADTLGGPETPITEWDFAVNSTSALLLHAKRPQSETSRLWFHGLIDTLGNKGDTFEIVTPAARVKGGEKRFFADPVTVAHEHTIYLMSQHPLQMPLADSMVSVVDTNGKVFPAKVEGSAYQLRVKVAKWPDTKMPYNLRIAPGFRFADTLTDTALTWRLALPRHDDFGSLAGEIVTSAADSLSNSPWVLQLYIDGPKGPVVVRRTTGGKKFNFDYLKPGIYTIRLINDLDQNGYYTPGSLSENRQPEHVVLLQERIEVKAKWDIEDFKASTLKGVSTMSTQNQEGGEDQPNTPRPGIKGGGKGGNKKNK
jgi:hypothetical protein